MVLVWQGYGEPSCTRSYVVRDLFARQVLPLWGLMILPDERSHRDKALQYDSVAQVFNDDS